MDRRIDEFAARFGLSQEAVQELRRILEADSGQIGEPSEGRTFHLDDEPAPDSSQEPLRPEVPILAQRYEDLGLIGTGGMGEVRRVRDRDLQRRLAMKIMRKRHAGSPGPLQRFVEEARTTAQLQHPGIVPLHELGRLEDGRFYFTMQEVRGRTLQEVIAEVHEASSDGEWGTGTGGWTFRRLADAWHRVCEAVAFAHSVDVLHCDLKPANIMVGEFGQVLVLDWGLARLRGLSPGAAERGAVQGTPAYMSPEQARGAALDARSDVYALGAVLYQILYGLPPYVKSEARSILEQVLAGPPQTCRAASAPQAPEELTNLCERAMARDPDQRYADAGQLAREAAAWLDGERKRERAVSVARRADELAPQVASLRRRAARERRQGKALLEPLPPAASEAEKAPGWAALDQAEALERQAQLKELEQETTLQAALTHAPDLGRAHAALAARYQAHHAQAESVHDDRTALRNQILLRRHAAALPATDPRRRGHQAYLAGHGALSIATEPQGAQVTIRRYQSRNRRLVLGTGSELGCTPLEAVSLSMGSYLLEIRAPGCHEVRYPVSIGRQEHWDGIPPGESQARPVVLPPQGQLQADECYVPAGWFRSGGDPQAHSGLPAHRLWCEGFVARRFPVTNGEYLAFLNDLSQKGREEEAWRYVVRERSGSADQQGAPIFGRDQRGRFVLRPDAEGDLWCEDWPVMMVDLPSALAFARWLTAATGQPWRLPAELEWEKAARGVDGRHFPWGNWFDPSWCCMCHSDRGAFLSVTDSFPVDESPYGLRGMAGNVADWCADRHEVGPRLDGARVLPGSQPEGKELERSGWVARGGAWTMQGAQLRCAWRHSFTPNSRDFNLGFRPVRSLP